MDSGVLSINIFRKNNNRRVVGINGVGEKYNKFYRSFLNRNEIQWEKTDFPWHFIVVSDLYLNEIILKYSDDVCYEDDSYD